MTGLSCAPSMAATFDVPRRFLILLTSQLLLLSFWSHEDRILNSVPVSFQIIGLDRPSFHFRRLSSFGFRRRPISSWQKHGYVCFLLPSFDLAICQDVERNPGPLAHRSIYLLVGLIRLLMLFYASTINQVKPRL